MDRSDLIGQLSNLITQISGTAPTNNQQPPASGSATALQQAQQMLEALLVQPQSGKILARLDSPSQPLPTLGETVIPAYPKGEHLVAVLIKGERFLLSTALDLKPGMDIRFNLLEGRIQLQPGPISAPTAQLNAEIQRVIAQTHPSAPPPLPIDTLLAPLAQLQNAGFDAKQIQQLATLIQQLPTQSEISQPQSLERLITNNQAPVAQQLTRLISGGAHTPMPSVPASGSETAPPIPLTQAAPEAATSKADPLAQLVQLLGPRNLPALLTALTQALPTATGSAPEAQPIGLQLPIFNYPFPQASSPKEHPNNVGAQLKRMAHWLRSTQDQHQLHQLLQLQSSNPGEESARPTPHHWFEIPFRVDHQLHWVQLHIQREQAGGGTNQEDPSNDKEQVWQLQLRLERPETGAIFASVYFKHPKLDIQFWAEQTDTLNALRLALPVFSEILKTEGVEECSVAANPGAMTKTTTALDQRRLHIEA